MSLCVTMYLHDAGSVNARKRARTLVSVRGTALPTNGSRVGLETSALKALKVTKIRSRRKQKKTRNNGLAFLRGKNNNDHSTSRRRVRALERESFPIANST